MCCQQRHSCLRVSDRRHGPSINSPWSSKQNSLLQAKAAIKPEVDAMFENFRKWYKLAQDDPNNPELPVKPAAPVRLPSLQAIVRTSCSRR